MNLDVFDMMIHLYLKEVAYFEAEGVHNLTPVQYINKVEREATSRTKKNFRVTSHKMEELYTYSTF
jgi:hypothetical protein